MIMKSLLVIPIDNNLQIIVKKAQKVKAGEILAKRKVADYKHEIPLSKILKVKPQKIPSYITKKIGAKVLKGEIIAQKNGLFKNIQILSPAEGSIDSIDVKLGALYLKVKPNEEVYELSPLDSEVEDIRDNEIILAFEGKLIPADGGRGDRAIGVLLDLAKEVDVFDFGNEVCGKILFGKSFTEGARAKLLTLGSKGLISLELYEDFPINVKLNEKQLTKLSGISGKNIMILGEKKSIIIPLA